MPTTKQPQQPNRQSEKTNNPRQSERKSGQSQVSDNMKRNKNNPDQLR